MQTKINLTRAAATVVARKDVVAGAVFGYQDKNGGLMERKYVAIGNSEKGDGRLFSVNIANGELASGRDGNRPTQLLGTATYDVVIEPDTTKHVTKKRSEVASGEAFIVPDAKRAPGSKPVLYAHMGLVNDGRYLSVNLATREVASSTKGNSTVVVVGKFSLNINLTK